VHIDTR